MEIKELVPKLVEHYQRCIDEMPRIFYTKYLHDKKISNGICFCAKYVFGVSIYNSDFIKDFTKGSILLCDAPAFSTSYSEAKELLQIRLNRLKEFL